MKTSILFILLFISSTIFSQITDRVEAQKFMEDNIYNMVILEKDKIVTQTNFPLEIYTGDKTWGKDEFSSKLSTLFSDAMRIELRGSTIDNIDAWVMAKDTSETYMLACFVPYEEYTAVVFLFKKFNGTWKLYGIDFQKE